ncbi:hypothetical protein WG926_15755 [Tistrella sp. BH-R2-4]|jgi:prolyl-tRNA synthetase|uniref:Uncharacterized protein n=1 Tax=Tistrella arctica TaxID=3133430 RepID=A0ABU9YLU6_9PROT
MSQTGSSYVPDLVRGGVIADGGYGKGMPIMRAWGLKLAERMVALFADRMAMGRPILVNRPGMLVEGDRYRAEVDTFGGFDFLYELNWAGHDVVARPDGAVANLAMAVRSRAGGGPATVLSCFQGFREIRGWTPPLFRDRLIWPFVQFNDLVPAAEAGAETAALLDRMIGFFDTLALPVRIIDMGPWKNYARRLYNVVGHLGDGSPTTLAMIFIVGDAYRHHAGVPEGLEAFDAGLTEKVLSMVLMRHRDQDGLCLPSALAPIQIAVEGDPTALPDWLRPGLDTLRVATPAGRGNGPWRRLWRQGVPLHLRAGRRGLRLRERCGGWSDLTPSVDLHDRLAAHDATLAARAVASDLGRATPPFLDHGSDAGRGRTVPVAGVSRLMPAAARTQAFVMPDQQFY